ncbi:membrane-bound lytic murein transglycosylase MltF [Thioalkalivibrio halophilus]|uniref:Membrane-bound lytic murein transglycosylase F n=1 Tax=Thioalkalivibrio halophilus TaxID=252474 RepID=A0A1V2ZZ35_9GAMM|nr:membrane-bound lytic murein transglycosylase MltF [Thioalkalivibrio halophilus]OOC10331.1 lytic transglycosylase F [Thioalkalivibrio halophilus]
MSSFLLNRSLHARHWSRSGLVAAGAAILMACGPGEGQSEVPGVEAAALAHPEEAGELVVVTRNAPTAWFYDRHTRTAGPEHDLVEAFAEARGWEVEWKVVDSVDAVLRSLASGDVHMAAAGLTHLASRDEDFLRGPKHTEVTERVVCHRDQRPQPAEAADLDGLELAVSANSAYVETLQALEEPVPYRAEPKGTERLLAAVEKGELDCTVADSHIAELNRRMFPHLEVSFDLSDVRAIGWYLHPDFEGLAGQARAWMDTDEGVQARARVDELYYAYVPEFDFVDLRALTRRIDQRLPDFRPVFEEAADEHELPADLLAALAYQESHWDPEARSPTGVRGLMMLTQRTAQELGIEDRLDPEQSIRGGARYLRQMHERLDEDIPEPDRTYLALASYNIGRGHLLDARRLARELGRDPDRWADMREVLPLLTEERYYSNLRYGYARGYQPVYYVQRIRNYRDVIRPVFVEDESVPLTGPRVALD